MLTCGWTAHEQAVKRCGVVHGDVSPGNLLIFPCARYHDDAKTKYVVAWIGVLSDWEMAKDLTAVAATRSARVRPAPPPATRR